MLHHGSRSGLKKLGLVALLGVGLFVVTAAGCGGDAETPPTAAPADTANTPTAANEPFTYDPKSASEIALVALEQAATPGAVETGTIRAVGRLLTELQEDCENTLEELAGYTLSTVNILRVAGVEVLSRDVLIDVRTEAIRAGGIDGQSLFETYVDGHGGG